MEYTSPPEPTPATLSLWDLGVGDKGNQCSHETTWPAMQWVMNCLNHFGLLIAFLLSLYKLGTPALHCVTERLLDCSLVLSSRSESCKVWFSSYLICASLVQFIVVSWNYFSCILWLDHLLKAFPNDGSYIYSIKLPPLFLRKTTLWWSLHSSSNMGLLFSRSSGMWSWSFSSLLFSMQIPFPDILSWDPCYAFWLYSLVLLDPTHKYIESRYSEGLILWKDFYSSLAFDDLDWDRTEIVSRQKFAGIVLLSYSVSGC